MKFRETAPDYPDDEEEENGEGEEGEEEEEDVTLFSENQSLSIFIGRRGSGRKIR